MQITINLGVLFALFGIPTAITAFGLWVIQRGIKKRDAKREKHEESRKEYELFILRGVGAALSLALATAESIQRLDLDCNGTMSAAQVYAKDVKNAMKDFLNKQGIDNLY